MALPSLIQLENISKSFGKTLVLDSVNLSIPYGQIFGIIGVSGSGKTTLLNIVIGFWKPDKGKVEYQGKDIERNILTVKQEFGFATQEPSFYPKLTVKENLEYFGNLYNLADSEVKERVAALLNLVELESSMDVLGSELSTGMRKRLDIACALINKPKVLILDEPTEDLDPILRKEILNLIKRINKEQKTTIIITSHILEEVEELCDRIAILHRKKILRDGTINELKNLYTRSQEIVVETASGKYDYIIKALKRNKLVTLIRPRGHKLAIYSVNPEVILHKLLYLIKVKNDKMLDVDVNRPSLNEVFENLIKK